MLYFLPPFPLEKQVVSPCCPFLPSSCSSSSWTYTDIIFYPQDQFDAHVHDGLLNVYTYYGSERTKDQNLLAEQDVVLTTYQTLSSEFSKVCHAVHLQKEFKMPHPQKVKSLFIPNTIYTAEYLRETQWSKVSSG